MMVLPCTTVNPASSRATPSGPQSQLLRSIVDRWRQGEPPSVRAALAEYPQLAGDQAAVVHLAYEEFTLREHAGAAPDLESFAALFPDCREVLRRLLGMHQLIDLQRRAQEAAEAKSGPPSPEPDWPLTGEMFLGFRILRQLGCGSFARVYLAQDPATGNRFVALKVSPKRSAEARTLGRLRHPNVVHVNSVVTEARTGLVAVCMDYVDGISLAQAMHQAFRSAPGRSDRFRPTLPDRAAVFVAEQNRTGSLAHMPYVQGCLHLAVQLADALAHLHDQGVVHGDVKPANVTLRADGHPVLIDFNLAYDTERGGAWSGGTPRYMAPEQLRAFGHSDPQVRSGVGAAADIYALGVILHEMLSGRHPFDPLPDDTDHDAVRNNLLQAQSEGKPQVGGIRDATVRRWVESCLALKPTERPTAAVLAAGLRDWLRPKRRSSWLWHGAQLRLTAVACVVALLLSGTGLYLTVSAGQVGLPGMEPTPAADEQPGRAETDDVDTLLDRARVCLQTGDVNGAVRNLLAGRQTNDARVEAALGFCYNLPPFRDHREAVAHYRNALAEGHASAAIQNNLGFSWAQRGGFAEAEQHLIRAIEMNPNLRAAWHNRARVELSRARLDSKRVAVVGVRCVRRAIEIGPATADLYLDAAILSCAVSARSGDAQERLEYRQAALRYTADAIRSGLDPIALQDPLLEPVAEEPIFQQLRAVQRPLLKPRKALLLVNPLEQP